jgi:hypothetical protein
MPRSGADRPAGVSPPCPFCEAADVELVAQFGGQIITSQWRCRACDSYFEAVRDEFAEERPV